MIHREIRRKFSHSYTIVGLFIIGSAYVSFAIGKRFNV